MTRLGAESLLTGGPWRNTADAERLLRQLLQLLRDVLNHLLELRELDRDGLEDLLELLQLLLLGEPELLQLLDLNRHRLQQLEDLRQHLLEVVRIHRQRGQRRLTERLTVKLLPRERIDVHAAGSKPLHAVR